MSEIRTRDAIVFAGRALFGFRVRSALTLLAMAIGVAAVIVLTALGEGARVYVGNEFTKLGNNLLIVFPGRAETKGGLPPVMGETPRDLTLDDAQALTRHFAVRRITPITIATASVSFRGREREAPILGTTHDYAESRDVMMGAGRFLPAGEIGRAQPVCVIGAIVRDELFGSEPALGQWVDIGDRRFQVIGVMANRGRQMGTDMDQIVVVPIASAMQAFNVTSLFRIIVEARGRDDIERVKTHIIETVKARHEGEDDVTVVTQDAIVATADRVLVALTLGLAGIAAISLAVAGILIMNVMLVSVSERTAEIGLLKAIGSSGRQVLTLFLLEATALSLLGALVGLGIGWGGAWLIGQIYPAFPVTIPNWAVAASLGVALATGIAFGVLPARRAARLDPVAALSRR